jgi:hypothetical protein
MTSTSRNNGGRDRATPKARGELQKLHRIQVFAKLESLNARGILTDRELLDQLILDLATFENTPEAIAYLNAKSEKLRTGARERLKSIFDGAHWRPFMIGGQFSDDEVQIMRERLRSIYSKVSDSPT